MKVVLVAMDKFKGTATAAEVCASVCEGINEVSADWRCVPMPLADGGDGTAASLCRAGWDSVGVRTIDGQGAPVLTQVAHDQGTDVIELADVCGIARWSGELRPWAAHTTGVGIAIRDRIRAGSEHIVVAAGGSASTDGGLGALLGLGFRITDESGVDVEPGLEGLRAASRIEYPSDFDSLRALRWTVLVDVDAPLFGPLGAAHRFGPQKGLSTKDTATADALLRKWNALLERVSGHDVGQIPGVGAAGGVAAPLVALVGARIESGFHFIAERVRLSEAISTADLVVTGEGRVDSSSLTGKVLGEVIAMAGRHGVEVVVVAGSIDPGVLPEMRGRTWSLVDLAGSEAVAISEPANYLRRAGRLIGGALA